MKTYRFSGIFKFFILLQLSLFIIDGSSGQERWFQIELSIFSNENVEDRQAEYWAPGNTDLSYPATSRRLRQLTDLFLSEKNLDEQSNIEKPLSQEDITNLIRIDQLKNIIPWTLATSCQQKFRRDSNLCRRRIKLWRGL